MSFFTVNQNQLTIEQVSDIVPSTLKSEFYSFLLE